MIQILVHVKLRLRAHGYAADDSDDERIKPAIKQCKQQTQD